MLNQASHEHLGIPPEKMEQFLDVCQAFKTVRDQRLFWEQFHFFDEYCRSKCSKSEEEVNRLIAEAELELKMRSREKPLV